jgi:uncharacterized protein (TIGR02117 family)
VRCDKLRQASAGLALVATLLLTGCLGPVRTLYPPAPHEAVKAVWLVSHGWHVGLAMRRADVSTAIWPESAEFGDVRYLEVGWGDSDFYPLASGTSGLALKAAFFSGSSVLHVTGFDRPVTEVFAGAPLVEIGLTARGFDALSRFIHEAYARNGHGEIVRVAPALYGRGAFYRAVGRYHALANSNTWAARALRAAGCPVTPIWALTAGNVLWQTRRFGLVISTDLRAVARQ